MSGVNVESLGVQVGGLGGALLSAGTLFTDNFGHTAGRTLAIANRDYLWASGDNSITPTFNGGSGDLALTTTSDPAGANEPMVTRVPSTIGLVKGKNQFSEVVLTTQVVNARSGPSVFNVGDGRDTVVGLTQQYILVFVFNTSAVLQSRVNNVTTNIGANFAYPGLGVRVALTVRLSGTDHILEVFYNQVSQGTRTVVGPTVATAGLPGLSAYSIVVGPVATEYSSFRCGLLTRLGY
jgi:hypothetical protein